jgi:hypothetical protein
MVKTIYALHDTDASKLAAVIREMQQLGAPTVRVVDCADYYMAIEGTHRLAAAAALGIAPNFEVLEQDDMVSIDSLDLDFFNAGEEYTAGELAGEVYSPRAVAYKIDDEGLLSAV